MADKFILIAKKERKKATTTTTSTITKASIRVQRNQKLKLHTSRIRLFLLLFLTSNRILSVCWFVYLLFFLFSYHKSAIFLAENYFFFQKPARTLSIAYARFTLNERKERDLHGCRLQIIEIVATHYSTHSRTNLSYLYSFLFLFAFAGWQK